jgi:CBS domain-containing protein
MKVKDILKTKGPEVFSIAGDKSIQEALKVLVNNNIGVLIVLNPEAKIEGIISERDIVKLAYKSPENFLGAFVKDSMTSNIIIVEPEDELDYVEAIMTEKHIRHLPVVKDQVLVGLISIGDLVKNQLHTTRAESKYLQDYISGNVR